MDADPFDQPVRSEDEEDADFLLRLDSYEGPIDVLLDQARSQRVDLAQVSILALAEQYLAFVERARRLRLDLAAEYLVMAAWLALLKSRLLLPDERTSDEPSAAEMAEALALQLRRLEAVRSAAERLVARPRLGIAVHGRGAPEGLGGTPRPVYEASLYELLQSYADIRRRTDRRAHHLRIEASRVHSVEDALARLVAMLGHTVDWTELAHFLPEPDADPLVARSALASTFAASLELVKSGAAQLRQERLFEEIYVKPVERRT